MQGHNRNNDFHTASDHNSVSLELDNMIESICKCAKERDCMNKWYENYIILISYYFLDYSEQWVLSKNDRINRIRE